MPSALNTLGILLVGNELVAKFDAPVVFGQALTIQTAVLPRFAQLWLDTSYLVNRYVNLIAFAEKRTPKAYRSYLEGFDRHTATLITTLVSWSPHSRS